MSNTKILTIITLSMAVLAFLFAFVVDLPGVATETIFTLLFVALGIISFIGLIVNLSHSTKK